jgi:hypothetical protein
LNVFLKASQAVSSSKIEINTVMLFFMLAPIVNIFNCY